MSLGRRLLRPCPGRPAACAVLYRYRLKHLRAHQRAFIAAAIGGAEIYQGRDMAAAHAGLAITGADFDAMVGHLAWTP